MYLRNGQEVSNPDPAAGLYIRSPSGVVVQARIPPDHLAFQMGEAMQVTLFPAPETCWQCF